MSDVKVLDGLSVGDWVTVTEPEGSKSFWLAEHAGERGCIVRIMKAAWEYPFVVEFEDGGEMGFKREELILNEDYLQPFVDVLEAFLFAPLVDIRTSECEPEVGVDMVNHPSHYADGWSNGAEVIDITENLNFNRGNAVKYIARAGKKDADMEIQDLLKAQFYINRELNRLGA